MQNVKYLPSCYVIGAKSVVFVPSSLSAFHNTNIATAVLRGMLPLVFIRDIFSVYVNAQRRAGAAGRALHKKESLPLGYSHIHLPTDSVQGVRCLPGWTCLRPTVETMSRESSVGHNVFEKLCARLPRGERFEDVELDDRCPAHRLDSGAETCPAREASRTLYTSVCCSEHDANTSHFAT